MKARTSWDGGAIAYPAGEPEITALKMSMRQDQESPFHCHPVPTFGYMLSGTLRVETDSGERKLLRAGDVVLEVMNTWHKGTAVEGPVEFIVFYAGAVDTPNTQFMDQGTACQ